MLNQRSNRSVKALRDRFSRSKRAQHRYRRWASRLKLDKNSVLLDQQNGLTLDGNIYCILKELLQNDRWSHLHIRFATTQDTDEAFRAELERRGLHVQTVRRNSLSYYFALATSTYLFTDNGLPPAFIKRPNQVVLNTWHGLPLKTLGRAQISDAPFIGNTQRNLSLADYILLPNEIMEDRFVRDYMLEGISTATVLPLAYPRNEAFVLEQPESLVNSVRGTYKRIYAWLPTFRGAGNKRGILPPRMLELLQEIDGALASDEVLYLKLHLVEQQQVDFSQYSHVKPIPSHAELYDVLSCCDALITDYSSVLFDFPLGGGKVVLFPYDESAYSAERGLYQPLSTLPFPIVRSTRELLDELRASKTYDDTAFISEYWPTPTKGVTQTLCNRILNSNTPLPGEHPVSSPEMPPALVYSEFACDLNELKSVITNLSHTYSVRLAFPWKKGVPKIEFLQALPDSVAYTPLMGDMLLSPIEHLTLRKGTVRTSTLELDQRRTFGDARFDHVVAHDGSDKRWLALIHWLQS